MTWFWLAFLVVTQFYAGWFAHSYWMKGRAAKQRRAEVDAMSSALLDETLAALRDASRAPEN